MSLELTKAEALELSAEIEGLLKKFSGETVRRSRSLTHGIARPRSIPGVRSTIRSGSSRAWADVAGVKVRRVSLTWQAGVPTADDHSR